MTQLNRAPLLIWNGQLLLLDKRRQAKTQLTVISLVVLSCGYEPGYPGAQETVGPGARHSIAGRLRCLNSLVWTLVTWENQPFAPPGYAAG